MTGTRWSTTAALSPEPPPNQTGGAQGNTIGGDTAEERNVISGNGSHGVYINGSGTDGNYVKGNYIGTDAAGTADLGNSNAGVYIYDAPNNTIGGTTGITPGGPCT